MAAQARNVCATLGPTVRFKLQINVRPFVSE